MDVKKELFQDVLIEFKKCKEKIDNVERAKCTFNLLDAVTDLQDDVQLSIPSVNISVVDSKNLINDANALILEASKWKGDIRKQLEYGYTGEKVGRIIIDMNNMVHDYNISHNHKFKILSCKLEEEKDIKKSVPEEEIFNKQDNLNE